MVDGLAVLYERRNDLIDALQFFWVDCEALPVFGKRRLVRIVRADRAVLELPQGAFLPVFTAIANVRRFRQPGAFIFLEIFAVLDALLAETALSSVAVAVLANISFFTVVAMDAGVEATTVGAGFDCRPMQLDFLRDGSRVFSKLCSNLAEGQTLRNPGADGGSVLQCEMRVF